jgi:hypothetical protein
MRYFCYNVPTYIDGEFIDEGEVVTISEDEIRENYYPHWLRRMYEMHGKEYVDEHYTFEDCLDQWIVVNWAWESTTDE